MNLIEFENIRFKGLKDVYDEVLHQEDTKLMKNDTLATLDCNIEFDRERELEYLEADYEMFFDPTRRFHFYRI